MPFPLSGVGQVPSLGPISPAVVGPAAAPAAPAGLSFQDVLLNSLENVNQVDRQAQSAIASGLAENDLTPAEVFTAVKKADLALRTMLQIRNKLVDAYNEIKQIRM